MSSDFTVTVRDVGFEAAGRLLLDDVTFVASPGEFVGIIGPNGAGKSTLLSIVGGSLRPDRGDVELMGRSVRGMSPREQAMVRSFLGANPPSDVPFPVRSVVEAGRYAFSGLEENGETTDRMRVDAAMKRADVAHLSDRVYTTLSSGEQARVLIARVLAQSSPVALLDEPTAALDLANAERALAVLSHPEEATTTVLCVLHDLNAAAYFCDRLLLLSDGRLVCSGSPEEVLESDMLSEIYGQTLKVIEHPYRPCPLVLTA